jgi:hypothetical protein
LLTVAASFTKFVFAFEAYNLVFIESIGNRTKSILVPAIPPESAATVKIFKLNYE